MLLESNLAILGGKPLTNFGCFPKDRMQITPKITSSIEKALHSESFSIFTSNEINLFENLFSEYVGLNHSILVNSCTNALFSSLLCHGIGPNSKVVIPAYTYIGTCMPVLACNATPIFVDIDIDTLYISAESLEKVLKYQKIDAVICALLFGIFEKEKISEIVYLCDKYNTKVIFDCAQLLIQANDRLSDFKDQIFCFSFGESKILRVGEGGAICTNNYESAEEIRLIRHEGEKWVDRNTSRITEWNPSPYEVIHGLASVRVGLNFRPVSLIATIGIEKLNSIDSFLHKTKENAFFLKKNLQKFDFIKSLDNVESWWTFPVLIQNTTLRRDQLLAILLSEGIPIGVHFPRLIPKHPVFSKFMLQEENIGVIFPNADYFSKNHLVFPIYPRLGKKHLKILIEAIKKISNNIDKLPTEEFKNACEDFLLKSNIEELNSGLFFFLE